MGFRRQKNHRNVLEFQIIKPSRICGGFFNNERYQKQVLKIKNAPAPQNLPASRSFIVDVCYKVRRLRRTWF